MCVVSNIGGYYQDRFPHWPHTPMPGTLPIFPSIAPTPQPPMSDVEMMRKFRELIERAKELDEATGEKDCEQPSQKDFIKQVFDRLDLIEKRLDAISRNANP